MEAGSLNTSISPSESVQCLHCNEKTDFPIYSEGKVFCCHGCQTIHFALQAGGLLEYYQVRERLGISKNLTPTTKAKVDFSYMNEPQFKNEFITSGESSNHIKFYIEGIHCLACIWLLEKLPSINGEVISARINFSNSILDLTIKKNCNLETVGNQISDLGYRPHVIKSNSEAQKLQQSEEHSKLIKIGVAGACSANIMLYSIAIYAGAGVEFSALFGWVSFILTLPVIIYSATPFYENSLAALKSRTLNIDIPISFAIIIGTVFGFYNLLIGSSHYYFDSLSILVFLLLSSRLLVQKSIQKGLNSDGLATLFEQSSVKRWNSIKKEYESIHTKFIQLGDQLLIEEAKTIPSDGINLSELSYLNNSLITGESRPAKVSKDENLFAGSVNLGDKIEMRVEKLFEDSTLGKIISEVEQGPETKQRIQSVTDKISRYFIAAVFSTSFMAFFYFLYTLGVDPAIERTLAIIIVSCPCALGLAAPLAIARAMNKAREKGIIIKNDSSLEDIARIKDVFFDKTGTLTDGNFSVVAVTNEAALSPFLEIIYSLEERSNHPIAHAIQKWTKKSSLVDFLDFQEIPGRGVSGKINDMTYSLLKSSNIREGNTAVDFLIDEEIISTIHLSDSLKKDSLPLISYLSNTAHKSHILSGDNSQTVKQVASALNIEEANSYSNQTPESKADLISQHKQSIMVGDGANDAIAMKKATVSIAVSGAMDIGLRASDIYLTQDPLKNMIFLMKLAKLTNTSIKINLIISLIYNLIGVTLSILGFISPLGAAILMPLSSLSVVIATLVKIKGLERA
ncbi:heavy metal translocating P-type ATPase [Halobacteriovorax sp. JY17]|uniref:heavy metal translocating P-type ATPase n=1 Tax=Halobacteriovorax sp. JY17 TaxID=2014617 RepID=UPI000C5ADFC8|nr:heavy metal translocating P-type ATPase [Halobacteriovorax sp. JY17]PIK15421.1 MAG: cadmium-translocating P-type ATPase [Halobacteriovorax sp. JY17]